MRARTILYLLLASVATVAWVWSPGKPPRWDVSPVGLHTFKAEVYGDAVKPACCRVLVPYASRAVNEIAPEWAHRISRRVLQSRPLSEMKWDASAAPAYLAVFGISLAAFLVLGLSAGWVAVLLSMATFVSYNNVGDPVTMAAFGVGLWACMNDRRKLFWLAFAVASVNRETAPLMLIPFVLSGGRLTHAAIAFAAFVVWRGIISGAYASNDMEMLWFQFVRNVKQIQPPSATLAMSAVGFYFVVLRGMASSDWWLGMSLGAMAIVLATSAVLFGQPELPRMWCELVPLVGVVVSRAFREAPK